MQVCVIYRYSTAAPRCWPRDCWWHQSSFDCVVYSCKRVHSLLHQLSSRLCPHALPQQHPARSQHHAFPTRGARCNPSCYKAIQARVSRRRGFPTLTAATLAVLLRYKALSPVLWVPVSLSTFCLTSQDGTRDLFARWRALLLGTTVACHPSPKMWRQAHLQSAVYRRPHKENQNLRRQTAARTR